MPFLKDAWSRHFSTLAFSLALKLLKVFLNGFRRFETATIYLDRKVIALVGPNEAGKTTVLDALAELETESPVRPTDLTRGFNLEEGLPSVKALYRLEASEQEFVREVDGKGKPEWYIVEKFPDGEVTRSTLPEVTRLSLQYRLASVDRLKQFLAIDALQPTLKRVVSDGRREQQARMPVGQRLALAVKALDVDEQILSGKRIDSLEFLQDGISGLLPSVREDEFAAEQLHSLAEEVEGLLEHETMPHPQDALIDRLEAQRPRFRKFGLEDRRLNSEYSATAIGAAQGALANFLNLAGVSPDEVQQTYETQDHGGRHALVARANRNLRREFARAWGQSQIGVELQLDASALRIHAQTADSYGPLAERSDGLRTFVALLAFVHKANETVAPVLLVDEAEQHLHYDAQADLVQVFYRQEQASQIIYTTHSAGCLPRDLGTDIRIVEPAFKEDGGETDRSTVKSDFWSEGPGFSPLMLAMGASVFAFSPTRYAVIAEGQSDVILLPTLLREATGYSDLPFQVAPGLATVSREDVAKLDLEAPKVAYFLDGDDGGNRHAGKLNRAGVDPNLVVRLPRGVVLEDLLRKQVYVDAINAELEMSHRGAHQITTTDLAHTGRPSSVDKWCASRGIGAPSKVRVAERLIDHSRHAPDESLLTGKGRQRLVSSYKELKAALDIKDR